MLTHTQISHTHKKDQNKIKMKNTHKWNCKTGIKQTQYLWEIDIIRDGFRITRNGLSITLTKSIN